MTLELHRVSAGYSSMNVIHEIELTVRPREIVTLIGANGAGKSTLVKTISGLTPTRAGTITFNGERIETAPTATRMHLGIVHIPEGRQIFAGLSVRENLELGAYIHRRHSDEADTQLSQVATRFPVLRGASVRRSGKPVWRSAADACHRTRTYGTPKATDA